MKRLSVHDVTTLAQANYDAGGDYVIELLTQAEIFDLFCRCEQSEGRRRLNQYMRSVVTMRRYLARPA